MNKYLKPFTKIEKRMINESLEGDDKYYAFPIKCNAKYFTPREKDVIKNALKTNFTAEGIDDAELPGYSKNEQKLIKNEKRHVNKLLKKLS